MADVASRLADRMTLVAAPLDRDPASVETLTTMAMSLATEAGGRRFYILGGATLEGLPGSLGMGGDHPGYLARIRGVQGMGIVAALANSDQADGIAPSWMALEYLLPLPPAGCEPVAPAP